MESVLTEESGRRKWRVTEGVIGKEKIEGADRRTIFGEG